MKDHAFHHLYSPHSRPGSCQARSLSFLRRPQSMAMSERWKEFEKFNGRTLKSLSIEVRAFIKVEWLGGDEPGLANVFAWEDHLGWVRVGHFAPKCEFISNGDWVFTASNEM